MYQFKVNRLNAALELLIKLSRTTINILYRKKVISSLLQRPTSDTSFVTPKGWFRIHFQKTGYDAPLYDLKELARAADSSYNYEVNFLKYPPPPKDFGKSSINGNPDDLYDIYIQNLGTG